MSFNGSGVFDPPASPQYPAISGDVIYAAYFNSVMQEIFDGLSNCLAKDGQSIPTGDVNWGNRKLLNVARIVQGTLTDDGIHALQINGKGKFTDTVTGVTAAPGTNDTQFSTTAFVAAMGALKANLASPALTGTPTAPTAAPGTNTTQLATTAFVTALGALKANIASPTFTGTPAAPTAAPGTNTTQLATTAFVAAADALKANLASPTFTGTPAAPTAAGGTNTTQIATTAFVTAGLSSKADTSALSSYAPLTSPSLTGTPVAPTASPGTNTTQIATTAFVAAADALKANLASPALTGTPTAPTAAPGTNTTQIASTAFVTAAIAAAPGGATVTQGTFTPTVVGSGAPGTGTYSFQAGHYVKIGNLVTFTLSVFWTAHTGSGFLKVAGLPFAAESYTALSMHPLNGLPAGAGKMVVSWLAIGSSTIDISTYDLTSGAVSDLVLDTAANIIISGSYIAD